MVNQPSNTYHHLQRSKPQRCRPSTLSLQSSTLVLSLLLLLFRCLHFGSILSPLLCVVVAVVLAGMRLLVLRALSDPLARQLQRLAGLR